MLSPIRRPKLYRGLTAALTIVGSVGLADRALASGGLFPARGTDGLSTVDQAAERILFEVGDGAITAHVQLHYQGAAEDFAWIIPVPSVPTVAESDVARLQAIDEASRLQVTLPPAGACLIDQPPMAEQNGCSCGGTQQVASRPPAVPGDQSPQPPVMEYGTIFTERYEIDTIESAYTPVLVEWLDTHGYHLGERMTPVLEQYNVAGTKFLAVRLREGRTAEDVVPLAITFAGEKPVIPLALTAVAAQPHMSVLVMILGDRTFLPENYVAIAPRSGDIVFDAEGRTSYFEWVARAASESSGRFFSIEYMDETPAALAPMVSQRYLTRFYTRVSPEQMTVDPVFRPHPNQGVRVAPMLDLSKEESLYDCDVVVDARKPAACGFNYCGSGSTCGDVDGEAVCLCGANQVAVRLDGPDHTARVTCVPADNPVGLSVTETLDPCGDVECGLGTCAAKAGAPTCACQPGAVARLVGDAVTCTNAPIDMISYGPGAGRESKITPGTQALRRPLSVKNAGAWAGLTLLVFVRRRRAS